MQYHNNIDKETGRSLYKKLTEQIQLELERNDKARESGCTVKCGTYGNRQVFKMDTNGPYTHLVEF